MFYEFRILVSAGYSKPLHFLVVDLHISLFKTKSNIRMISTPVSGFCTLLWCSYLPSNQKW